MSPASLMIIGFLLAIVAMSFAFAGGAVIVTVPLVLIGIAVVGFLDYRRRHEQVKDVEEFREQAPAESVEFTARDKETLTSE
jgi:UDP-N-acetylmuramyl pentapeptide phosphotransferase/UDP-N-acetylglucosamine-1-phosphate transferase